MRTFTLIVICSVAVSCSPYSDTRGGSGGELDTAIVAIEAGRETTPLVNQTAPGSDATVTFLVQGTDGQVPRIVSDVTGWGESPDDSDFDLTIGTMTRLGSTEWHRLETQVAPKARIEYLIVYGETDYRTDANNPRRAWSRGRRDISEFVTPDYVPPRELSDPPMTPAGTTVEATIYATCSSACSALATLHRLQVREAQWKSSFS